MLDIVEDKASFERVLQTLDVPAYSMRNPNSYRAGLTALSSGPAVSQPGLWLWHVLEPSSEQLGDRLRKTASHRGRCPGMAGQDTTTLKKMCNQGEFHETIPVGVCVLCDSVPTCRC